MRQDTKQLIDGTINLLSFKQRAVFVLRELAKTSIRDTVRLTRWPASSVSWHLYEARSRLKKIFIAQIITSITNPKAGN